MRNTDKHQLKKRAGDVADILRAMSNSERLLILCNLTGGEQSVSELGQTSKLSQSALSQHLAVLRNKDLVKTRKDAQTVYYSIADQRVLKLLKRLEQLFCE